MAHVGIVLHNTGPYVSYSQSYGDNRVIWRMDVGLCIGFLLWPMQKSIYRIHVLLAYQKIWTIAHMMGWERQLKPTAM